MGVCDVLFCEYRGTWDVYDLSSSCHCSIPMLLDLGSQPTDLAPLRVLNPSAPKETRSGGAEKVFCIKTFESLLAPF